MSIEIFIEIAVLAFVVLVVFIIMTLIKFSTTMDKIDRQLDRLTTDLAITQLELNRTLRNCQNLCEHVDHKVKDLDPLFSSINKLGIIFNNTNSLAELNHCRIEKDQDRDLKINITPYVELVNVLISIFKQFKKRK